MKAPRDLTKQQFTAALRRHGMELEGVLGYVMLGIPGRGIAVSYLNAPSCTWRSRLKFLLDKQAHYMGDARPRAEEVA